MGQFDVQLKLSIGGSNFQLRDWTYAASPIVESGKGRTGTRVVLAGEGWVEAGDAAALAFAVFTAVESFSVSGQLITVSEHGTQMAAISPGQCTDGGPHIDFTVSENIDFVMGGRNFKFSAKAEQQVNPGEPTNAYTIDTTTTPDTLRIVVIKGDITGAGAPAFYTNTVLPAFAAAYPVNAGWVMLNEVNNNQTGDKSSYTITFTELAHSFDYEGVAPPTQPVEGEATVRRERDAQMRLTTHYLYDVLLKKGEDPIKLLDFLRPQPAADIVSESSETTVHHGIHLRAEFVLLNSANGNYLMDFEQSFSQAKQGTIATAVEFPGLDPLLVLAPTQAVRYVQQGRSVGYKKFYVGPEIGYLPYLESQPVIKYAYLSDFEYETTWTVTYIAATEIDQTLFRNILKDLLRPAKPSMF